jgi:hypothetical protein
MKTIKVAKSGNQNITENVIIILDNVLYFEAVQQKTRIYFSKELTLMANEPLAKIEDKVSKAIASK